MTTTSSAKAGVTLDAIDPASAQNFGQDNFRLCLTITASRDAIGEIRAESDEMSPPRPAASAPPPEEDLAFQVRSFRSHREDESQVHLEMTLDLHDLAR